MNGKIRIGLVASGGGTDANAVMTAYRKGQLLPECEIVGLLSTKAGAGCLEKAAAHDIPVKVIERYGMFTPDKDKMLRPNDSCEARKKTQEDFNSQVSQWLWEKEIRLLFLLGCIHNIPTNCMASGGGLVEVNNIHPAHPHKHGGRKMYSLAVHKHVLAAILDELERGMADLNGNFFTYPTVHRVTAGYDQGSISIQVAVPIPKSIILEARDDLEVAADKLQKVVLPVEHLMLPAAVNIAARLILDGNEPSAI